MSVSPLGYLYRWRVGVGLEAAFQDSPNSFSALNVPGLAWAMEEAVRVAKGEEEPAAVHYVEVTDESEIDDSLAANDGDAF